MVEKEKYLQIIHQQMECLNGLMYNLLGMMNLDNGIPQTQVIDTPCMEGETNMAKRIKQRVKVGDTTKWATGYSMQEVMESAARLLMESSFDSEVKSKKATPFLKDYLPKYQATYKQKLRKNTKAAYEHLTRNYIMPNLGNKQINEITTGDIQIMYDSMVDKGLAEETIKKVRNILRPCFESALEDELIERNPFNSNRLEIHTDKGTHHKVFPLDIMDAIKADIPTLPEKERCMMALLSYAGLRVGEVLGLRWSDIDFENAILHVKIGVTHPTRNQPEIGLPKTKASIRDIPMDQALIDVMMPLRKSGYVIGGQQPLTCQQDKRLWDKLRKRYHLEGYSRHDFRATCATVWFEQGIPLLTIQAMLGHEDSKTTTKYYTKVRESSLWEAKRIMDSHSHPCDINIPNTNDSEALKNKGFRYNPPPEMRHIM